MVFGSFPLHFRRLLFYCACVPCRVLLYGSVAYLLPGYPALLWLTGLASVAAVIVLFPPFKKTVWWSQGFQFGMAITVCLFSVLRRTSLVGLALGLSVTGGLLQSLLYL